MPDRTKNSTATAQATGIKECCLCGKPKNAEECFYKITRFVKRLGERRWYYQSYCKVCTAIRSHPWNSTPQCREKKRARASNPETRAKNRERDRLYRLRSIDKKKSYNDSVIGRLLRSRWKNMDRLMKSVSEIQSIRLERLIAAQDIEIARIRAQQAEEAKEGTWRDLL